MGSNLPPHVPRPGTGGGGGDQRRSMSPLQGAQAAAKRLGKTCFHAGQRVPGFVGCVACQFQIRNRGVLPSCPDCGEMVWAWLDEGPPPVLDGVSAAIPPPQAAGQPKVEEGVALEPTVQVQENVSIEPT